MYHEYSANSFSSGLSSYASNHSTMNPTTLSSLPKHLPTDLRPRYRSFVNEREGGYLNQVLKSMPYNQKRNHKIPAQCFPNNQYAS